MKVKMWMYKIYKYIKFITCKWKNVIMNIKKKYVENSINLLHLSNSNETPLCILSQNKTEINMQQILKT